MLSRRRPTRGRRPRRVGDALHSAVRVHRTASRRTPGSAPRPRLHHQGAGLRLGNGTRGRRQISRAVLGGDPGAGCSRGRVDVHARGRRSLRRPRPVAPGQGRRPDRLSFSTSSRAGTDLQRPMPVSGDSPGSRRRLTNAHQPRGGTDGALPAAAACSVLGQRLPAHDGPGRGISPGKGEPGPPVVMSSTRRYGTRAESVSGVERPAAVERRIVVAVVADHNMYRRWDSRWLPAIDPISGPYSRWLCRQCR